MKMLVTKFSSGRYHNEGELFAEAISSDNVKLMGEMIALQALRTVKKHDFEVADELYTGLIKDLHHMNEAGYIIIRRLRLRSESDMLSLAICRKKRSRALRQGQERRGDHN